VGRRARTLRLAAWGLGGVALGVGLLVLALNVVARSERGHEFVLQRTLDALAPSINGTLSIDRISGNLFEGASVYGLRLEDGEGRSFIVADSGYLEYRVTTLLSPRIHIRSAVLFDPEVYVFRLPGDTLWNYEAIFADTTPGDPSAERVERATLVDLLRIRGGFVRVQLPWEPDPELSPRAQRAEVELALSDSSTVLVDSVPGGYLRTMNFEAMQGRVSRIRFAPGTETGSRLHVDSIRTRAQIFREPAELVHAEGIIALLPGHIEVDAPLVRLPGSRLSVSGVVRSDGFPEWFDAAEAPMYDLAFRSDSVRLRDLQWLYPLLPEEGGGSMSLRIEHRPEGLMFLFRDARVALPGTRVAGSFGMVAGDTLRFVEVDVEAEPVDARVIDRMLPEGLPVVGLRLGGAEIRGSGGTSEAEQAP
jgi:hypothetical protein